MEIRYERGRERDRIRITGAAFVVTSLVGLPMYSGDLEYRQEYIEIKLGPFAEVAFGVDDQPWHKPPMRRPHMQSVDGTLFTPLPLPLKPGEKFRLRAAIDKELRFEAEAMVTDVDLNPIMEPSARIRFMVTGMPENLEIAGHKIV